MRRTMHVLAATGLVLGLGLTALPATAGTLAGSAAAGRTRLAAPRIRPSTRTAPIPARQRALARAARIQALLGQRGTITGMVRGADGAPRANVCVKAFGLMASRTAFSRADGRFVISGLPRGAYRVEYRGCSPIGRYVGQWYGGPTRASAAPVLVMSAMPVRLAPVTLGRVSPWLTTPKAAQPPVTSLAERLLAQFRSGALARASGPANARSARISGRVTSQAGHPLKRICVFATPAGRERFSGFSFFARTTKSGEYAMRVPRPGRYYVLFLPVCAVAGNFAPQLWKGAGSVAAARVLRVRAHQVISHIDAVLAAGAAISGRVHAGPHVHASFAGLCVFALGVGGQRFFYGFTTVRAGGTFRLRNLATGKYQLQFFPGCGPQNAYLPTTLQKPVAVTDGKTTTGISVLLRLGGMITGVVKDAGGHPLTGICVSAFDDHGGSETQTGAGGTYLVEGLSTGRYQMQFSSGCGAKGAYAPLTLPSPIAVTAGKTTSGVNAIMQLAGAISGVVKDSGGNPLGGICVIAQGTNGDEFDFTSTAADGTYRVKGLAAGEYQVAFVPGGLFSGCGSKGNYLPVTLSAAVSIGKTTRLDAVLPTGGVISGVVTDRHGKPLAGICVFASGPIGNQTRTASDGSYSLTQLFSGSYDVGFSGGCGNGGSVAPQAYHRDPTFLSPTAVSVTAGQTTAGIDAAMRPGGTITGHVTDSAGHPLSRVCVFISGAVGAGGGFQFGDFEITRDGNYRSANLPPGLFTVTFSGVFKRFSGCTTSGRYADQNFRGRTSGAQPDLISVRAGVTTSGINAALAPAGTISGFVRSRSGAGLPDSCVAAIDPRSQAVGEAFAGSHGKYTLTDIPAGRYKVQFSSCDFFIGFGSVPNYAPQWYRNRADQASATAVAVRAGRVTAGISATMAKGGSIAGQVVFGPGNRPVSFVCVFAFNSDGSVFSVGLTDRRGNYVVSGLSTGRYNVAFEPCSGESALAGQFKAEQIQVIAGRTVRGINERLQVGGSVSGVVSAQGPHGSRPAPGACVEVLATNLTNLSGIMITTTGGGYSVGGLAPGTYLVYFGNPSCSSDSPALAPQFYAGKVQVVARQTVSGISATLARDGEIAGVVRGPGHSPVAGICAEAMPLDGGTGTVLAVTTDGGYAATGLVPGSYKVRFESGCGATGYATRWYKNARVRGRATIVSVSAGTITDGIGITLPRG